MQNRTVAEGKTAAVLADAMLRAWKERALEEPSKKILELKPCGCTGMTCPLTGMGTS